MKTLQVLLWLFLITAILPSCLQEDVTDHLDKKLTEADHALFMTIGTQIDATTPEDHVDFNFSEAGILARKKHPVPFHATVVSTLVVFPPQPNPAACGTGLPVLHIDQTLTGNATHMGNVSGTIESCLNVSTSPPFFISGLTTMVAANGDSLFILGFEDPYTIDGGSGRFENATGTLTSTFEFISPGVFRNFFDGEIQY